MTMGIGQSLTQPRPWKLHRKSTRLQPHPYILCWFVLDTTGSSPSQSGIFAASDAGEHGFAISVHWGKQHAIFAGMDCAVH